MSVPAGWYPDPQPPAPGSTPQQRYWDGQAWTAHVAPAQQQATPYASYPAYAGAPEYGSPVVGRPTTPDGAPLAGWWHRVGASLIDYLILAPLITLLTLPFVRDLLSAFGDYFDAAMTAAENEQAQPSTAGFEQQIAEATLAIGLIGFVVSLVYTVAFLSWKQATPGKLAVGLRIRLRESPDLPMSAIILRWATQSGVPGLVGLVPVIGFLGGLFSLVNVLWPLWDDKCQALHDKVAKTNVVRTR